jgi:hypothetical protein
MRVRDRPVPKRVPRTPEAASGDEEEETQEQDLAEAAPEGSCALQPSCKSIDGPSRRVSSAGRARHTNAPADRGLHSGELDSRVSNLTRNMQLIYKHTINIYKRPLLIYKDRGLHSGEPET